MRDAFSDIAFWVPLIYHKELEMKETTKAASSVSFLDIYSPMVKVIRNAKIIIISFLKISDICKD
jgi:hypothetical protein